MCCANSFASLVANLGYNEPTIASLIGHKIHSVTSRYMHSADAVLLAAADAVANGTMKLLAPDEAQPQLQDQGRDGAFVWDEFTVYHRCPTRDGGLQPLRDASVLSDGMRTRRQLVGIMRLNLAPPSAAVLTRGFHIPRPRSDGSDRSQRAAARATSDGGWRRRATCDSVEELVSIAKFIHMRQLYIITHRLQLLVDLTKIYSSVGSS